MLSVLLRNNALSKRVGQVTTVFFLEASSAIAFSIFYAGLSIYLTNHALLTQKTAIAITGMFLALNYFLPLIGSVLVSKIITYKRLYLIGIIFSFIGCLILAGGKFIYFGLSLFLINSLSSKVCVRMFVTNLFDKDHIRERRVAFLWSYIGMNTGFLIGFLLTGFFTNLNNYTLLFSTMSVFLAVSAVLCSVFIKPVHQELKYKVKPMMQIALVPIFLVCVALTTMFFLKQAEIISSYALIFLVATFFSVLAYAIKNTDNRQTSSYVKFIIYWSMALVFWTAYMLTPTAIMQIIQNNVDNVVMGVRIAPAWFVNIDSIVILILASQLAIRMNKKKDESKKSILSYFSLGFVLTAIAFSILYCGVLYSSGKIPAFTILAYLVFISAAEVFIGPISDSIIGEIIPKNMHNLITGVGAINLGIGSLVAGYISRHLIMPSIQIDHLHNTDFLTLKTILATIALLMGIIGFISWLFSCKVAKNMAYNN